MILRNAMDDRDWKLKEEILDGAVSIGMFTESEVKFKRKNI